MPGAAGGECRVRQAEIGLGVWGRAGACDARGGRRRMPGAVTCGMRLRLPHVTCEAAGGDRAALHHRGVRGGGLPRRLPDHSMGLHQQGQALLVRGSRPAGWRRQQATGLRSTPAAESMVGAWGSRKSDKLRCTTTVYHKLRCTTGHGGRSTRLVAPSLLPASPHAPAATRSPSRGMEPWA
jgi:hypothetical protein